MKKILIKILLCLLFISNIAQAKLKIGVSMLPYYSFASNIVKDKADVIQILPTDADVHTYQPTASEVKKIANLDVLIINGTGIDNYMYKLITASNNKKLKIISASKNVSLLPVSGQRGGAKTVNTHTFISIQASIQQVNTIAQEIAKIDSSNSTFYLKNAREYNRKLSNIKSKKLKEISEIKKGKHIEIATTHAGYDYILAELGMNVAVVIEPKENSKPSASDLKDSINLIKSKKVNVLFESDGASSPYVKQIQREANLSVEKLLHMTNGKYTSTAFEKDIEENLNRIIRALKNAK